MRYDLVVNAVSGSQTLACFCSPELRAALFSHGLLWWRVLSVNSWLGCACRSLITHSSFLGVQGVWQRTGLRRKTKEKPPFVSYGSDTNLSPASVSPSHVAKAVEETAQLSLRARLNELRLSAGREGHSQSSYLNQAWLPIARAPDSVWRRVAVLCMNSSEALPLQPLQGGFIRIRVFTALLRWGGGKTWTHVNQARWDSRSQSPASQLPLAVFFFPVGNFLIWKHSANVGIKINIFWNTCTRKAEMCCPGSRFT